MQYLVLIFLIFGNLWGNEPLTLEQCQQLALENNPLIDKGEAQEEIAYNQAGIAKSTYFPELNANASYRRFQQHAFLPKIQIPVQIPTIVGPENDYNFNLKTRMLLYDFGERQARWKGALSQMHAAEEQLEQIEQSVLLDTALAFHNLAANLNLREVAKKTLERAKSHFNLAEERKKAGDSPLIDVYRTQVEVANAELALTETDGRVRIAEGGLNSAMGRPAQTPIAIVTDRMTPKSPDEIDLFAALAESLELRPELHAACHQLTSLRYHIQERESAFGPKIVAEGGYGRRDTNYFPHDREWSVGVGVELNLFRGFADWHSVKKAKAELTQGEAEYRRLELMVQEEVWNAYSKLRESFDQIKTTKAQLHDTEESLRLAVERYKVGASTLNDLLDSQTSQAKAQARHVEASWKYWSAFDEFLWAQGILGQ